MGGAKLAPPLEENMSEELVPNWHRFDSMKHSTALPMAFTEYGVAILAFSPFTIPLTIT
jgi:hypothetical protein